MVPACQTDGFCFERDTFTFANELIWQYQFDAVTGAMKVSRNKPPPTYSHRCFVVVRAAREFYYHARFESSQRRLEPEQYRPLVRKVMSRNPRIASLPEGRIVFPGYECLRAFSQENEKLLKEEIGGAWRSYFLRSHWRMIFPVHRWQQARMAERLRRRVLAGCAPIVHLFRFPRLTINHGILLFSFKESASEVEFDAYDPNIPANQVKLKYDRASRTFLFPASIYWGGGPLNLVEFFRGGLY